MSSESPKKPDAAPKFAAPTAMGYLNRITNQPIIGVKRQLWRSDDEHADSADIAFEKIRKEALSRDHNTCRFCGFRAGKYQEVHHLDDDHKNNSLDNLVTVCTLCHQVFHIGMLAIRNAGFIAAIPELTQTEVINIARVVHVSELLDNEEIKTKLKSLFAIFQMRGFDTLKVPFKADISSPYFLAPTTSSMPDDVYDNRAKLFESLRIVPTKEAFHGGQLEYYAKNCPLFKQTENWLAHSRQLFEE